MTRKSLPVIALGAALAFAAGVCAFEAATEAPDEMSDRARQVVDAYGCVWIFEQRADSPAWPWHWMDGGSAFVAAAINANPQELGRQVTTGEVSAAIRHCERQD